METLVLVLDSSFKPVDRVPWQRALTLYFKGKVEIIEHYAGRVVRAASAAFQLPSVVRFLGGLRSRRKAIKFSRENVYARDNGSCQYCGNKVPREEFTYDHVKPRSKGGLTEWTNVVCSCIPCNQLKGGRTPQEAKMHLRSVPVKPKKLPDTLYLNFVWKDGMPEEWRGYMRAEDVARDVMYWHGELDSE